MTQSKEATLPTEEQFESAVDRTQALPPMLILEVGGTVDGVLKKVNAIADEDKPGKNRYFYQLILLSDASGLNKDREELNASRGEVVSLPGSGGLDFSMKNIAAEEDGKEFSESAWRKVYGWRFTVTRLEDEKMSKGKHKGKPVHCYKVLTARPKGK